MVIFLKSVEPIRSDQILALQALISKPRPWLKIVGLLQVRDPLRNIGQGVLPLENFTKVDANVAF